MSVGVLRARAEELRERIRTFDAECRADAPHGHLVCRYRLERLQAEYDGIVARLRGASKS